MSCCHNDEVYSDISSRTLISLFSIGTPWYNIYHGQAAAHFLELLDYDAFAIGNHEFDSGVDSFVDNFVRVGFKSLNYYNLNFFTSFICQYYFDLQGHECSESLYVSQITYEA